MLFVERLVDLVEELIAEVEVFDPEDLLENLLSDEADGVEISRQSVNEAIDSLGELNERLQDLQKQLDEMKYDLQRLVLKKLNSRLSELSEEDEE